jgi:Protein of unknown function (DUF3632)
MVYTSPSRRSKEIIPPQGEAKDQSIASQYDVDVQGLSPYILVDVKKIFSRTRQHDAFPRAFPPDKERTDLNSPETVVLWHGHSGWSVERWGFWKQRLREIRDTENVRKNTKETIDKVIAKMEQVENGVSSGLLPERIYLTPTSMRVFEFEATATVNATLYTKPYAVHFIVVFSCSFFFDALLGTSAVAFT